MFCAIFSVYKLQPTRQKINTNCTLFIVYKRTELELVFLLFSINTEQTEKNSEVLLKMK